MLLFVTLQSSGKKGKGNGDRTKLTPEEIMNAIEERREKKKGSKRKRTPSPTSAPGTEKKKSKKRFVHITYMYVASIASTHSISNVLG